MGSPRDAGSAAGARLEAVLNRLVPRGSRVVITAALRPVSGAPLRIRLAKVLRA